jgi:hypothetical protein
MNYTPETPAKPVKPSETLNVLTILTFIGCAYELISAFMGFISAEANYKRLAENQDKMQDAPAMLKSLTGPGMVDIARKTFEHRLPILLLTLVAAGLCAYGAFLMRSLKKQGFYIYLVGELLPAVTSLIFIGAGFLSGIFLVFGLIINLVFIGLYANQLKSMH